MTFDDKTGLFIAVAAGIFLFYWLCPPPDKRGRVPRKHRKREATSRDPSLPVLIIIVGITAAIFFSGG